jgi:hypothetical protein
MPQPNQSEQSQQEGKIELALQAIQQGQFKSVRHAATAFNVQSTLQRRYSGDTTECLPELIASLIAGSLLQPKSRQLSNISLTSIRVDLRPGCAR